MTPQSLSEILAQTATTLQPRRITCAADKSIGRLEAEILLAHTLKKDRVWLLAHPEHRLTQPQLVRFQKYVARRKTHEPIAYILGEKDFYGRPFLVTKDTLIPRPETELMIETVLERLPQLPRGALIWDVGTGSGAIGVTFALELSHARVLATDVSSAALRVALKNAKRLGAKNIAFLKADLLDAHVDAVLRKSSASHLVVTANLPYLPKADQKILEPDVVKFEPSSALFCGRDGLEVMIRFLDQIALAKHAWHFSSIDILLEFDPPQAKQLQRIAKSTFPDARIEIRKDLARRNRLLLIAN